MSYKDNKQHCQSLRTTIEWSTLNSSATLGVIICLVLKMGTSDLSWVAISLFTLIYDHT